MGTPLCTGAEGNGRESSIQDEENKWHNHTLTAQKKKRRRTGGLNLRTYDKGKGARGGDQCDSNERSKDRSFHDEKRVNR